MFDLATITNATNNFSPEFKIGAGGFGPVYKVSISYANVALLFSNHQSTKYKHIYIYTSYFSGETFNRTRNSSEEIVEGFGTGS